MLPKKGKVPIHYGYYVTDTTNPNFHEHPFWPVYASGSDFPSNADVVVKRGTIEEWYLINTTMEAHAFHIHQMAFVQEKSWAGIPITTDTVFVAVGSLLPNPHDPNYPLVKPRVTKVLLDFRNVPRGTFVFHCHMLFHEDHGMMAIIKSSRLFYDSTGPW
jgi:FtsP/CotA-like multicopper oxidase with cupredoxin domain